MAEDLAAKYGVPLVRSAVGEANVVDAMLAQQAVFGGEGNGGPIDPRVGLVRDSFVGMARLLDAMASYQINRKLSANLNVTNLLDKKYHTIFSWYSTYTWGEPRSAMLTLKYKF